MIYIYIYISYIYVYVYHMYIHDIYIYIYTHDIYIYIIIYHMSSGNQTCLVDFPTKISISLPRGCRIRDSMFAQ